MISCKAYRDFLIAQEPNYDKEILRDYRPTTAGLIGFYNSGVWDAYSGTEHTVDRFRSVFPNVTTPWTSVSSTECSGTPCDDSANTIGWGYTRSTYGREKQSWKSQLICFDQVMSRNRAKEHFRAIIDQVLRPATSKIMAFYLARRAAELAGKKICVAAGLPDFTFTWDSGGYVYLTSTQNPTGRLTPDILRSRVRRLYGVGAIEQAPKGYEKLQLHTDQDTFHYLAKEDPILKGAWRFGTFATDAQEFYKYGLDGYAGDFMVKCLDWPIRFNKVSSGRYQVVLPYKNVATTSGIGDEWNDDYDKAQYQWSYINNPRAIRVMPFKAAAVNPEMPFMIREYGGKWKFAINDLGADCNGKPIENFKENKGMFWSEFDLAMKPENPQWLELFFHKVDRPCITIIDTCNTDPGAPEQSYSSSPSSCPSVFVFTAVQNAISGNYKVAANTIEVNGNTIVNSAIDLASFSAFVAALPAVSGGTWAVLDATAKTFTLTGSTATSVSVPMLA